MTLFRPLGVHLDLVLLIVVVWSSLRDLDEAAFCGLVGGACIDLFSGGPFGASVLVYGLIALGSSYAGSVLRQFHELATLALVPLASVSASLLFGIVVGALGWRIEWPAMVALVVLPGAVVNTVASPIVFWALHTAADLVQPQGWSA